MSAVKRRFPPLPTNRDVLRMYQITAKKNMSQNFILDPSILKRIAKAAGKLKRTTAFFYQNYLLIKSYIPLVQYLGIPAQRKQLAY